VRAWWCVGESTSAGNLSVGRARSPSVADHRRGWATGWATSGPRLGPGAQAAPSGGPNGSGGAPGGTGPLKAFPSMVNASTGPPSVG
jgi:hypothetical protein